MKTNLKNAFGVAAACLTACTAAQAQTNETVSADLNRFGLSYRMGFNIKASFKNLGGFPAQTAPGPASGNADRVYDDGYNRVDSSGNAGGRTWFWGYTGSSLAGHPQVPGNDTMVMHSSSSPASGTSDNVSSDPQHGFELTYNTPLGHIKKASWGLWSAFNYTAIRITDNSSMNAPVTLLSDAYGLAGITPPLPPYSGSQAGPGPLLGASPARGSEPIPNGASIFGQRSLEGNLYGIKIGPYLNVPLGSKVVLSLNGGLAAAFLENDFRFNETVSIEGVGTVSHSGAFGANGWLIGGFVGTQVRFHISHSVDLFGGAEYQNLGCFSQQTAEKEARLNLADTLFVNFGLGYSF